MSDVHFGKLFKNRVQAQTRKELQVRILPLGQNTFCKYFSAKQYLYTNINNTVSQALLTSFFEEILLTMCI